DSTLGRWPSTVRIQRDRKRVSLWKRPWVSVGDASTSPRRSLTTNVLPSKMLTVESAIVPSSGRSLLRAAYEAVKPLGQRVVALDLHAALQCRREQVLLPPNNPHEVRLLAADHAVGRRRALGDRHRPVAHLDAPAPRPLDVEPIAAVDAL